MDQKSLALFEAVIDDAKLLKHQARNSLPMSDEVGKRLDENLELLIEDGADEQIAAELNSRRHRAIRPDISYNPHSASAYRGKKGEFFGSLGEQLQAVFKAAQLGQEADRRLYKVNEKETRASTGLSEGIPSDGGFLLEGSFTTDLVKEVFETGQLAKLCQSFPITRGNSIKLPVFAETSRVSGSRLGGVTGYWLGESGTKIPSKPKFRQMELSLNKLIGLCFASDEILEDAQLLEKIIRKGFASEFGFLVDDAIVNGTGVACPLGLTNSGSLITVTRNTPSTITYQDLINMWPRLLGGSGKRSIWLINQDCLPQLLGMTYGTGGNNVPVYVSGNSAANAPFDILLGRPCLQIEQAQTMGSKGDILLCDFAEGYVLGEKGGIQFASSIHVNYVLDETAFRFVLRISGQPVLAQPILPAHGTNSLSHFICLS